MSFHYRYRKQIMIIVITILVITTIITTTIYFYEPKKEQKISSLKIKKTTKESKKSQTEQEKFMVDIKGEVISPGIYELENNSRVIDVIKLAGGLTENADTTVINLSKKIEDEMVIIIYSKWQVENWKETKEQEKYLQEQCISPKEGQTKNDACIDNTEKITTTSSVININTATKEELMTLTGIGEAKAEAIISYREKTPFTKIEDIKNVSGIGDSVYEDIKDYITV